MSIGHLIIITGDWGLSQRLTWKEADISIPAFAGGVKKQSLGFVLAKDGMRRRRNRAAAGSECQRKPLPPFLSSLSVWEGSEWSQSTTETIDRQEQKHPHTQESSEKHPHREIDR